MSDAPPETSPTYIGKRRAHREDHRVEMTKKNTIAMWCTLIDLVNNSFNTATMYQEGFPEALKRDYGSGKKIAEASVAGIKAMIAQDPASYSAALKFVGKPNAFPFVIEDDDFLSSEDEEESDERRAVKQARA